MPFGLDTFDERLLCGNNVIVRYWQIVLKNSGIIWPFCELNFDFDLDFIYLLLQICKIRFDDSTAPIDL